MNIQNLIRKGRLHPITKFNGQGKEMLVGYERSGNSRKSGQQYWLKKPVPVAAKS